MEGDEAIGIHPHEWNNGVSWDSLNGTGMGTMWLVT